MFVKNQEYLIQNSLLVSIIDGSIIDLTRRGPQFIRNVSRPYSFLDPQNCLKKRKNPFGKMRVSDQNRVIPGASFNNAKTLFNKCPNFTKIHTKNSNSKRMKIKDSEIKETLKRVKKQANNSHCPSKSSLNPKNPGYSDLTLLQEDPVEASQQKKSQKKPQKNTDLKNHFSEIFSCMFLMNSLRRTPHLLSQKKKHLRSLLDDSTIRTSTFENLKNLLIKFLLNQQISGSDLMVSDIELVLFTLFLVKKTYNSTPDMQWSASCLRKLQSTQLKKRSEQNYKVILKRFFKKMISTFNSKHRLESNDDLEFYRFHFEEVAGQCGEDWKQLRYSMVFNENEHQNTQHGDKKSKKVFAQVLSKNTVFIEQMRKYMTNKLVVEGETSGIYIDYTPILMNKLGLLIDKWKAKLYSNKNLKARLCKFVVDQIKNKKVKLPWGYSEIDNGVLNIFRLFKVEAGVGDK